MGPQAPDPAKPLPKPRPRPKRRKPAPRTRTRIGRPPHVPDEMSRNLVMLAMLNDFTQEQTATLAGIERTTLIKYYGQELQHGKMNMLARVSGNVAKIALQNQDMACALKAGIFILKSKGKWNDRAGELGASLEMDGPAGPLRWTLKLGERSLVEA